MRCVEEANLAAGLSADSSPFGGELAAGAQRVAVVVGVPCHRSDSVPSLAYSTRDAVRMAEMLEASGFAVLRLTSAIDASKLLEVLEDIEGKIDPSGVLVVYFSGHGVLREDEGQLRRYLVFSDTELGDVENSALAVLDLQERVSRVDTADRIVLQDTCFAARPEEGGKSLGIPNPPGGRHKGMALPEGDRSTSPADQRFFASRFFEQALESIEYQGSVYTHHFLAAVDDPARADMDGDGCVGTLEAHTYAASVTSSERRGFQTPQLQAGELHNVALSCTGEPTSGVLLADEWLATPSGPVEPGRHKVALSDPKTGVTVYRGSVKVEAGEWLALDGLVREREPYNLAYVSAGLDALGAGPAAAVAGGAWVMGRDGGLGRPAAGVGIDWIPKVDGKTDVACLDWQGSRTTVRGGWFWSTGAFAVGPTASGGVTVRRPYCPGADEDEPARLPSRAGGTAGLGAHGHLSIGPVAVVIDAEANAAQTVSFGETSVLLTPSLKGGLGFRF